MKETLERLESIHAKISDYAEVLDKELLKLYSAELESNLALLKEEIEAEILSANVNGYREATATAIEIIKNGNK